MNAQFALATHFAPDLIKEPIVSVLRDMESVVAKERAIGIAIDRDSGSIVGISELGDEVSHLLNDLPRCATEHAGDASSTLPDTVDFAAR